jgi:glucose-6-phosphate isomerase
MSFNNAGNDYSVSLSAADADAVAAAVAMLGRQGFMTRLWQKDPGLWKSDASHQDVARNRLGWLEVVEPMLGEADAIDAFADQAAADGYTDAVLLGMGGSSLAPEVLAQTFGTAPGRLALHVLDNTSPDAVRAADLDVDLTKTLFLVSSKSGTTTETLGFFRYFFERLHAIVGDQAGRHFIAITDPGTPLERIAAEHDFRRAFINPADIGGRYSALSYFGLVPAALAGVNIRGLLTTARALAAASAGDRAAADNPALYLGAAMGALAGRGRDKLTLLLAPTIATFGTWVEQLVAESTGKEGRGVLPVEDEPLGAVERYGSDRLFVAVDCGDEDAAPAATLEALASAGHPVLRWRLDEASGLGGEFMRWELATAVAGALLAVDPFDEPNVTESKDTTRALLGEHEASGTLTEPPALAEGGALSCYGDPGACGENADPHACLKALFGRVAENDYLAMTAYLRRTDEVHERLNSLRAMIRDRLHVATTLGYGPRFLHSTGQFHKGGPDTGVFLQITADPAADLAIPDESYSFGVLNRAQALGDLQVLQRRGRRALRVHISGDVDRGLAALVDLAGRALEG